MDGIYKYYEPVVAAVRGELCLGGLEASHGQWALGMQAVSFAGHSRKT